MNNTIKFMNDYYLDSSSIVHNKEMLSAYLTNLQKLMIKTPEGNTQITKLELGYHDGWVLIVTAISDGQELKFIADLTQING